MSHNEISQLKQRLAGVDSSLDLTMERPCNLAFEQSVEITRRIGQNIRNFWAGRARAELALAEDAVRRGDIYGATKARNFAKICLELAEPI